MDELLKKILEDNSIPVKTVEEFEQEYEAEMRKPSKERDLDLLGELAETIMEMKDIKPNMMPPERLIALAKERRTKRRIKILKRWMTAACVALVLFLPLNLMAEKAYGMNFFSAMIRIIKGGMDFDFNRVDEVIDLPKSDSDPHGFKSECESYGMNVLLPTYIPKDFQLVSMEFNETAEIKFIDFIYKNSNQKISINIQEHQNDIPSTFQLPMDTQNLEELNIDGRLTFVTKEKTYYKVLFSSDLSTYHLETQNLDYEALMAVLYSFK